MRTKTINIIYVTRRKNQILPHHQIWFERIGFMETDAIGISFNVVQNIFCMIHQSQHYSQNCNEGLDDEGVNLEIISWILKIIGMKLTSKGAPIIHKNYFKCCCT